MVVWCWPCLMLLLLPGVPTPPEFPHSCLTAQSSPNILQMIERSKPARVSRGLRWGTMHNLRPTLNSWLPHSTLNTFLSIFRSDKMQPGVWLRGSYSAPRLQLWCHLYVLDDGTVLESWNVHGSTTTTVYTTSSTGAGALTVCLAWRLLSADREITSVGSSQGSALFHLTLSFTNCRNSW